MSLTPDDVKKMKVDELKSALKKVGELTTGKKADLAARLLDYIESHASDSNNKNTDDQASVPDSSVTVDVNVPEDKTTEDEKMEEKDEIAVTEEVVEETSINKQPVVVNSTEASSPPSKEPALESKMEAQ